METGGPQRVLVITAHPDDADVHAGGTLARWVEEGGDIHAVIATSGEKGHDDPGMREEEVARLRRTEQQAAATMLGIQRVSFLDYRDGELAWAGPRLAEEVTRLVRQERPDIVVTHDPYMGPPRYVTYQLHPDHRALGFAVIDAVYFRAPGPLFYPEHRGIGLRPHRVAELFLIMGDHADHAVEIGRTFERKVAAVRAHASQWGHRPDLEAFLRQRAQATGAAHGLGLAEAFKWLRPG